jgi:hypothetical protein
MATKTDRHLAVLSYSFGFNPQESRHHFLVKLPKGAQREIQISEHFTWTEQIGSSAVSSVAEDDGQIRVLLARPKWDAIADEVKADFTQRLRKMGCKSGSWRVGNNLVRRELGKELVLLAWAIEDADPGLIPNALANWRGLVPEERWWLYTQTAAATGHGLRDRGKGWRKAVRFALTENPVGSKAKDQPMVPEFFRIAAEREEQRTLFNIDDDDSSPSREE